MPSLNPSSDTYRISCLLLLTSLSVWVGIYTGQPPEVITSRALVTALFTSLIGRFIVSLLPPFSAELDDES